MKVFHTALRARTRREKMLLGAVAALSALFGIIMISNYLQEYAQQASVRLAKSERQLEDVRTAHAEHSRFALLDLAGLRMALAKKEALNLQTEQDTQVLQTHFSSWQSLVSTLADIESSEGASDLKLTVSQRDGGIILTAEQDDE